MPSLQRDVRIFSTINRIHLKFLNPETCSSTADWWLVSLPHASQAIQFNWPAPFLPKAENWNPFRWESSGHLLSMATAATLCIVHSLLSAQLRYTFSASVCVCVGSACVCINIQAHVSVQMNVWVCIHVCEYGGQRIALAVVSQAPCTCFVLWDWLSYQPRPHPIA